MWEFWMHFDLIPARHLVSNTCIRLYASRQAALVHLASDGTPIGKTPLAVRSVSSVAHIPGFGVFVTGYSVAALYSFSPLPTVVAAWVRP